LIPPLCVDLIDPCTFRFREREFFFMDKPPNSFRPLYQDLCRRFNNPFYSTAFYATLIFVVLIGGGLGIWLPALFGQLDEKSLAMGFLTYFPAIATASFIEFFHDKKKPYMRNFGLLAGSFFLVTFVIALACSSGWQLRWAVVGTVSALLFWWLGNGEKEWVWDNPPPDAPQGGDPSRPLLKGKRKDFRT